MEWNKAKPVGGSKYGLQLKFAAPAPKKPQLSRPTMFTDDNDEEYTVEDDIARQASKKQLALEVDVQVKQALEQDASAFDYDGVYDRIKGQQAQGIREERAKRDPKYIGKLLEKAKVRAVEQDVAFERRLAKERDKDEHLFPDKEKFVTTAYKKKLIEQGKWQEEERQRELREKAHEISGKRDLSDFYRNLLHKNVAFGGKISSNEKISSNSNLRLPVESDELSSVEVERGILSSIGNDGEFSHVLDNPSKTDSRKQRRHEETEANHASVSPSGREHGRQFEEGIEGEKSREESIHPISSGHSVETEENFMENSSKEVEQVSGPTTSNLKSKEETLAAAKQRYLERKRQRNN